MRTHKRSRGFSALLSALICILLIFTITGCEDKAPQAGGYERSKTLDTSKDVVIKIAYSFDSWPELQNVITKFEAIYPNCTVLYESIEEYLINLPIRLNNTEDKLDLFVTTNIQANTPYKDNAYNLISDEAKKTLDLSKTNQGLLENFRYLGAENTQYSVPFGGEMRGMYINVTLLKKFGLEVPSNRAELLKCCEALKQAGYIPFQGTPGTFGQQLLYPSICNKIVNGGKYDEMYAAIENIEPGISEYFRDEMTFLYDIVKNNYYDYKRVETELGYMFSSAEGKARDFLNILMVADDQYEKKDDLGQCAFIVDTQAFGLILQKVKDDYHSQIEYVFIPSPVGEDGGYAYLSPSDAFAINNKSDHIDWALEFLNFFYTPEISTAFAKESGKIPNTADALLAYDIPAERTCDVGQVTFSYSFYKTVTTIMLSGYDDMVGISKMNAPKYMADNGDGTYSIRFTLDEYMARLEQEFQKVKQSR